ncbi:poly [ADP-ribose] polymerase 9-like [Seriola lalandi dorsalis]|uniref:Poly [ADP-ribose] polymerase 9-like n=1 Tax=Seriola lalandi dorsalis TaxID=1841481 RepID=A0A3B4YBT8_SERLL|nr:poly [ADP-ribose] polymerase 9-like [Seriola lalandi dorsalis]XP_023278827.1 poly [ADP-ribose] polymerase 9-like [Seriola lalandi dorsalis]
MASHLDFPLDGSAFNIVKKCGPALSDVLESKFGCVATIEGVDFERGLTFQQRRPTIVPVKRFAATLRSGVTVSVWKADLTNFQVDAVVNAANTDLEHCGGLAAALSHAGGPQIRKESNDYIKRNGPLKTGDAIISDAWSLPCKKIIHAVGPQLKRNPPRHLVQQAEPQLKRAIRSILARVRDHRLKTVAIPAISSGLFNFPLPLCAEIIVSTVKDYCNYASSGDYLPEEIMLVNNDDPSVQEMERACRHILVSQTPMTYSQATAAKTLRHDVQIGNVRLTLKRGRIEEQQTDVIVNTASSDRDLSVGQISNALLSKAGSGMQHEIYGSYQKGNIITTKGYHLQCKEVYHTFCTGKGQVLFNSVLECLWNAAASQHKSIAFPAIGTGALSFSKSEAAQIMSNAVADFACKWKAPTMMEVHFVILHSDNDTFKAFEEQMKTLQKTVSHPGFTQAPEHRDEFHESKPPTPQIGLSGSDETTREAERWLSGFLKSSGSVTIRNNFILHFGKQEYLQLSRLAQNNIFFEESFKKGQAEITVNGSHEDVVVAGFQVEAMLCNIQREFVKEEEQDMLLMSTKNVSFERKTMKVDDVSHTFSDRVSEFKKDRLHMTKLEKVENPALETLFNLKKKQLQCHTSRRMFQRIPAQFCGMVSHIGFRTEYAPPADPEYGEGIYFAGTMKNALKVWKDQNEEYLYFVEAEVLTGNSTPGKPGLILPPAVGKDPLIMYDSVSGGSDVSVIFSSYQALPRYIITCKVV